jgi:cytochrome c6
MKTQIVRTAAIATLSLAAVQFCAGVARAQSGESNFKAKCAACHGADGKGATAAGKSLGVHDFTSDTVQKMSDADLAGIITNGKNKMPAYGKSLKDPEIQDLVAYIRVLGKK